MGVWLVAGALIATKFLDCWTTARRMRHPAEELNPLARWFMTRWGPTTAIRGVFLAVVLIVAVVTAGVLRAVGTLDHPGERAIGAWLGVVGFLVLGSAISALQLAVAHANWTGRTNLLTRAVAAGLSLLTRT